MSALSGRTNLFLVLLGSAIVLLAAPAAYEPAPAEVETLPTTPPGEANLTVISSGRDSIIVNLGLDGVGISNRLVDGQVFQDIFFDGSEFLGIEGAPDLPTIRRLFAVPDCGSVTVEVTVDSFSVLNASVNVRPFPRVVRDPLEPDLETRVFEKESPSTNYGFVMGSLSDMREGEFTLRTSSFPDGSWAQLHLYTAPRARQTKGTRIK